MQKEFAFTRNEIMRHGLIVVALLFASLGCSSSQKRIYDVTVQNASSEPLTLWLTKDCEPYENGWLSPEDLAVSSPKNKDYIVSGVIVPAGKTASTGPRQGHFDPEGSAVLRIYDGQLMFNEILAIGRDSPLRIDLPLPDGASEWRVTRDAKGLIHVRPAPATQPTGQ
jgi:hypothetical protein